jgi:hypothetical protein
VGRNSESTKTRTVSTESLHQKLILIAFTVLGIGFILVNVPVTILLGYSVLQLEIASQQVVSEFSGRVLFMLASIALMILGLLFVIGAIQYYGRNLARGVVFLGTIVASFYLLCLGVGSVLLIQEANLDALLILSGSVLIMVSVVLYMMPSFPFKMCGALIGVLGGVIIARFIYNTSVLDLVFEWGVPFTGPFMSMATLEGIVVILGPIAALANLFSSSQNGEKPLTHGFLSLNALIYGISLFVGSLVLFLSLWNWIWKSPWIGPFHAMQSWILSTIVFWSASLFLLVIGGIILVISSFVGFILFAQEVS